MSRDVTPPDDLIHPNYVRDWYKQQKQNASLAEDLKDVEITPKTTVELDDRTAETNNLNASHSTQGM